MKTLKERLSELEKELTPVCKAHEDDCDKCPYKCTKCREYIELAAELERQKERDKKNENRAIYQLGNRQ